MIIVATPDQAGCWVDGSFGQYADAHVILSACASGWLDMAAFDIASRWIAMEPFTDSELHLLVSFADDAEAWMNENIAPEGYMFGWHDGEFFMMTTEWWME